MGFLSCCQSDAIPVIYPDPFELHRPGPGEKFIAYLPHSGFHNQRIELENALLLASYLNRTLLLPPVFLGNPAMPWLRYDKMYERLLLQTKRGLEHWGDEPLPAECLNYFRWTQVPWSFFYDLEKGIKDNVRIVFRDDLSQEWILDALGLKRSDIYYMKDMSPYEFRVYDKPDSATPLAKFVNRIDLATLEAIDSPMLHFGSVFAQTEEHAQLLKLFRTEMIFRNPILYDTASRVARQLGGVDRFVGLHIRVGDGLFKVRASIHVDDIYHKLVDAFTDLTQEQVAYYEDYRHDQDRQENEDYEVRQLRKFKPIDEQLEKPIVVSHPDNIAEFLGDQPPAGLMRTCQAPKDDTTKHFQKTVIYIATDAPSPRTNPLLRKIFATFPCVFVLSDFNEELHDLKRIQVVEEKVKLESYLIPMVDAMIAAQGHTFHGTADSTFSSYIERQLHPVYTGREVKVMNVGGRRKNQ
ncbi:CigA protein [Fennellomyces sp. T-0311]|nr:CigA protein [Fennellomyces sp. T-0311]